MSGTGSRPAAPILHMPGITTPGLWCWIPRSKGGSGPHRHRSGLAGNSGVTPLLTGSKALHSVE